MFRLRIAFLSALALLAIATAPAAASGGHSRYGETTLKLDPGAISGADRPRRRPGADRPGLRALAADTLAFPITNSFKGALRTASIRHSGGISLTAGGTTVELRDFSSIRSARQLTALVGGARVPILSLDFSRARLGLGLGLALARPRRRLADRGGRRGARRRLRAAGRDGAGRAEAGRRDGSLPALLDLEDPDELIRDFISALTTTRPRQPSPRNACQSRSSSSSSVSDRPGSQTMAQWARS